MIKLAVIDFCETVASFQTLDPFLEGILKKERPVAYRILSNKLLVYILNMCNRILFKLGYVYILRKRWMVRALKNISVEKLEKYGEKYYIERVKPHLIPDTIHLIKQFQTDGYKTVIVSGGSDFYIRYFAKEYGIDDVVSADIEVQNGRCTGRLLKECLMKEKVSMLYQWIQDNSLIVSEKVGVTDSMSDLPLLNECDRKIIISHKYHKEWVTKEMEEIIWE